MGKVLTVLLCICAVAGLAAVAHADPPPTCETTLFPSANERFGFGVTDKGNGISTYDVLPLNAGWYLNWGLNPNAPHPGGILGVHEIHVHRQGLSVNPADIARITEEDPGALWIIGNEPDVVVMDNVTPGQYATQYRQAYHLIKGYDPTAQVAAGGIAQPTPLRLGWLSAVWDAYLQQFGGPLPADVWNIHNFILQEKLYDWGCGLPPGFSGARGARRQIEQHDDLALFQDQIRAMRQWMYEHGEQNKPLINSEYGILFPEEHGFDLARVSAFFINSANWMLTAADPVVGYPADDNRLVQRWLWYSLDDTSFDYRGNTVAALMDPITRQMRDMGHVFAGQTTPLRRPYVNLVIARVRMTTLDGSPLSLDATQQVTLSLTIQNRGNTAIATPFRVTIQDEHGLAIHSETINGLPARYGGDARLQTSWQKPAGAGWRLEVWVDPDDVISESDECDNRWTTVPATDLHLVSLALLNAQGQLIGATTTSGPISVTAEVQNLGDLDLAGATLRLHDGAQVLYQATLPRLAPQARVIAPFFWASPAIGPHELQATVSLPAGVADRVEGNNRIGRSFLVADGRAAFPIPGFPQANPCRNVVVNPGFESGTLAGWESSGRVALWESTPAHTCADNTRWCVRMERSWNLDFHLHQTVTLAAWTPGAQLDSVYLTYQWGITTAAPGAEPRDTFTVTLRSTTGQLLRTIEVLDNRNPPPNWKVFGADISEFANQTIQLHFDAHHAIYHTSFWLDEIYVEVCEQRR